jgi:hypothetical protein
MNVDIGTEATQLPEKEYINGIFVAVHVKICNGDQSSQLKEVILDFLQIIIR